MLAKFTKSILITCLFTTLLLPILACAAFSDMTSSDPNRSSIKDLNVTMDVNQLEEFRAQLRKFANKHSLEYTEKFYNKDKTEFSVYMDGDNFHISINNFTNNLGKVGIGLFNEASPPLTQETLNEIVNDLRDFVNKIPNVTITEKVKTLKITIESNRVQEIHNQIKKFADKHSLKFTLSFSSDKSVFNLEMYGNRFHITGKNSFHARDIDDIYINFYTDTDNETPNSAPISQEMVDKLFSDLKSYISEIPNVIIVEEK